MFERKQKFILPKGKTGPSLFCLSVLSSRCLCWLSVSVLLKLHVRFIIYIRQSYVECRLHLVLFFGIAAVLFIWFTVCVVKEVVSKQGILGRIFTGSEQPPCSEKTLQGAGHVLINLSPSPLRELKAGFHPQFFFLKSAATNSVAADF